MRHTYVLRSDADLRDGGFTSGPQSLMSGARSRVLSQPPPTSA
jgi:hypothetical protein